jgi:hypothetical protein
MREDGSLISFYPHKDPARVMKLAVLDDKTPAPRGETIEYWRGPSDWQPIGKRKQAFDAARALSDMGRVALVQAKCEDRYSYQMRVLK